MGPPTAIEHAPSAKNQGGKSFATKGIWTAEGNPRMPKENLAADSFSKDVLDFLLLLHEQDRARGSHPEQTGSWPSKRPQ